MRETDAILQSILYQLETTEDIEKARMAVRAMCTKENIDAVTALIAGEVGKGSDKQQKEG